MLNNKILLALICLIAGSALSSGEDAQSLKVGVMGKTADFPPEFHAKLVQTIKLPKGYHEGLFKNGHEMWVCNGKGISTWRVNLETQEVLRDVNMPGTFTEAVTRLPDGRLCVSDWDEEKIYFAVVEGYEIKVRSEFSTAPENPAGVLSVGDSIYYLTWQTGLGTKYYLNKCDLQGKLIERILIGNISEPSQLAWDGKYLWISSWYSKRIFRVDTASYAIVDYFKTRLDRTTGIYCEDGFFWVTGTDGDLFRYEMSAV